MGVNFTFEARTYIAEAVLEEVKKCWLKDFANPMSAYQFGARAKYLMELSRDRIGSFLSVDRDEIFFVASYEEAITWAKLILRENLLDWPIIHLKKDIDIPTNGVVLDIEGGLSYLPLATDVKEMICLGSFREIGGPIDGYFIRIPFHLKGVALIHGGHQERARRAGTQNLPTISGMGKALFLFQRDRVNIIHRWEENQKKVLDLIPSSIRIGEIELAYLDLELKEGQKAVVKEELIHKDIICDFVENSVRLWIPYELKDEELIYIKELIRIVEESYE